MIEVRLTWEREGSIDCWLERQVKHCWWDQGDLWYRTEDKGRRDWQVRSVDRKSWGKSWRNGDVVKGC